MKGQVAVLFLILLLIGGGIVFFIAMFIVLPVIKSIATTPILDPPAVGAITALFGFLPEQCSVLSTTECRYCLMTEKLTPFVVNIAFSLILFSVLLGVIGGPKIEWNNEEETGLVKQYGPALLMSIAFSIFLLHQPDPWAFVNIGTWLLAIVVRILSFVVLDVGRIPQKNIGLTKITDFFLATYILVFGWNNWWWVPIIVIAGFTIATGVVGNQPVYRTQATTVGGLGVSFLILLVVLTGVGFYVYGVFEHHWWTPFGSIPFDIKYPGLGPWIADRIGISEIKCGANLIGPDSTISL